MITNVLNGLLLVLYILIEIRKRFQENYEKMLKNMIGEGIPFSTPYDDKLIAKFEEKHNLSINVYGLRWQYNEEKEIMDLLIFLLRISKIKISEKPKNTEGYEDKDKKLEDGNNKAIDKRLEDEVKEFNIISHYCAITSMSRLLTSTFSKHHGKTYVCRSCCNNFKTQELLDKHAHVLQKLWIGVLNQEKY